jgi:hypothetical protein
MVALRVTEGVPAVALALALRPGPAAAALLSGGGAPAAAAALRAAVAAVLLAPMGLPLASADAVLLAALRVAGAPPTLLAVEDARNAAGGDGGVEDLVAAAAPGGVPLLEEEAAARRRRAAGRRLAARALQGGGASATLTLVPAPGNDEEAAAAIESGACVVTLNLLADSAASAGALAARAQAGAVGAELAGAAAGALSTPGAAFTAEPLPGTVAQVQLLLRRTKWAAALEWLRANVARVAGGGAALAAGVVAAGGALAARRAARRAAAAGAAPARSAAAAAGARDARLLALRARLGLLRYAERARQGGGEAAEGQAGEEDLGGRLGLGGAGGDPRAEEGTPSPVALPPAQLLLLRPTPRPPRSEREGALARLAQYKQLRRGAGAGGEGAASGALRPTSA